MNIDITFKRLKIYTALSNTVSIKVFSLNTPILLIHTPTVQVIVFRWIFMVHFSFSCLPLPVHVWKDRDCRTTGRPIDESFYRVAVKQLRVCTNELWATAVTNNSVAVDHVTDGVDNALCVSRARLAATTTATLYWSWCSRLIWLCAGAGLAGWLGG